MTLGHHLKFGRTIFLSVLMLSALAARPGRAASAPPLPLTAMNSQWRPLSRIQDPALQTALEQTLNRPSLWRSLRAQAKLAVALVDLADPEAPRFAQVNGDTMMYGASLPKLAILLAAYQGFADGALPETPQLRADLIEMIRRSDNAAAARLTARLGLGKIEALLTSRRYRFYDPGKGGGLWLGGGFAPGGEHHPEPLKGLIQAASARQVCRFYYLLAYGQLISPESSRQMLKILAFPDLPNKFVKVLAAAVPPARLYRKSGEFGIWHSDSILVWGAEPWRRYILVGLVEHRQGEEVLQGLVPAVELLLRAKPSLPTVHPNGGIRP